MTWHIRKLIAEAQSDFTGNNKFVAVCYDPATQQEKTVNGTFNPGVGLTSEVVRQQLCAAGLDPNELGACV